MYKWKRSANCKLRDYFPARARTHARVCMCVFVSGFSVIYPGFYVIRALSAIYSQVRSAGDYK